MATGLPAYVAGSGALYQLVNAARDYSIENLCKARIGPKTWNTVCGLGRLSNFVCIMMLPGWKASPSPRLTGYLIQFSTLRLRTRENSPVLSVTRIAPAAQA